jgi:hypothetical protein
MIGTLPADHDLMQGAVEGLELRAVSHIRMRERSCSPIDRGSFTTARSL